MISVERAWEIACENSPAPELSALLEDGQALESGWFFPWRMVVPVELNANGVPINVPIGSNGVIVNKKSGVPFILGSAFNPERDIMFYDLGYQANKCDLVVLRVADMAATLDTLLDIGPSITELSYEAGTVWRIPRRLTRSEIADQLAELPCIFDDISLYFRLERLHESRMAQHFDFKVLPRPAK